MIETEKPSEEQNWFEESEQVPMGESTVEHFEKLCENAFGIHAEIKSLEQEVKEKKKELAKKQTVVLQYFDQYKKTKHVTAHGTISVSERLQVPLPKGEDKLKFFEFLKSKGCFFDMVHMNSKSLQSFYKAELDEKIASGEPGWSMPGVGEPVYVQRISMRKK